MGWHNDNTFWGGPPDDTKEQIERNLKLQKLCKEIEFLEGRKVPADDDASTLVVLTSKRTSLENEIKTRQRAKKLQEKLNEPTDKPAGLIQPSVYPCIGTY